MNKLINKSSYLFVLLGLLFALTFSAFQPIVAMAVDDPNATTATTPDIQVEPADVAPTPTPADSNIDPASTPIAATEPAPTPVPTPEQQLIVSQPSLTGPQEPSGADESTYVLNPDTGMWENDHYIWNPVTNQTSPKDPVTYSYNPQTGMWDTTKWIYDAAKGAYEENVVSVATNPTLQSSSSPLSVSDSAPVASDESSLNGIFNLFFNSTISNNIASLAQSGDATVAGNTLAGNAITGNATGLVNLFNMINSLWGFLDGQPTLFTADINGDVVGDLLINPQSLASSGQIPAMTDLHVNSTNNGAINNNIQLDVASGDASVQLNTTAGDASSGNATAMANIVNLINSSIGAGQSFLGMVNINGSLDGDILLPSGLLDGLLAGNVSPCSSNQCDSNKADIDINLDTNQTINNQITANANSGLATLQDNTSAGNATTGAASTNVTILNLTGKQVIGKDALLVFVNVLGNWTGLIMNAPTGTTAGLIGGDANQSGPLQSLNGNADINVTNNSLINNVIALNAASGDASVTDNTSAGNAKTGNASASVNLLNISNSSFSLSDWFGILFINVFGNWHGSFGVNTAAGNPIVAPPVITPAAAPQVFAFIPKTHGSSFSSASTSSTAPVASDPPSTNVLGTAAPQNQNPTGSISTSSGFVTMVIVLCLAGLVVLIASDLLRRRIAVTA